LGQQADAIEIEPYLVDVFRRPGAALLVAFPPGARF
jgi:hypothetical protein